MTDIQGYTDKSSGSSRQEIVELIRRHGQLMIPVIEFYGGRIIKSIGDAFLVTFESATDGVVCAIIIQLILREYNSRQEDPERVLNLRVVINTGDVSLESGDIYGDAVNITARMEGLPCFPGGSIGISQSTFLLMNRNEIVTEEIGPMEMKGIPEPVTVYSVPLEKQRLTTIPAKLTKLVEASFDSSGGDSAAAQRLAQWKDEMGNFLQETNWGENIGQIRDSVQKTVDRAGKRIARGFTDKSILEKGRKKTFRDAAVPARFKSFVIDAVLIWAAGFAAGLFFGHGLIISVLKFVAVMGYLSLMWGFRGATIGQIACGLAVLNDDDSRLDLIMGIKRALLFVVSAAILFLGMMPLLLGQGRKTFYDQVCGTKVVR